jgi:hypothetical protein
MQFMAVHEVTPPLDVSALFQATVQLTRVEPEAPPREFPVITQLVSIHPAAPIASFPMIPHLFKVLPEAPPPNEAEHPLIVHPLKLPR